MKRINVMDALDQPRADGDLATNRGPRAALQAWVKEKMTVSEILVWLEDARLEAILGSCRRSIPSVRYVRMSWDV